MHGLIRKAIKRFAEIYSLPYGKLPTWHTTAIGHGSSRREQVC